MPVCNAVVRGPARLTQKKIIPNRQTTEIPSGTATAFCAFPGSLSHERKSRIGSVNIPPIPHSVFCHSRPRHPDAAGKKQDCFLCGTSFRRFNREAPRRNPSFRLQNALMQYPRYKNTSLYGHAKTGRNINPPGFCSRPARTPEAWVFRLPAGNPVKGSCAPRRRRVHEPRQCACAIPACRPPYPGWGTGPRRKSWPPGPPPGIPIQ